MRDGGGDESYFLFTGYQISSSIIHFLRAYHIIFNFLKDVVVGFTVGFAPYD